MQLKHYLSTLGSSERESLAKSAGTTVAYLAQLSGGHRKPGPALARRLVEASQQFGDRTITLADVRPDIWG